MNEFKKLRIGTLIICVVNFGYTLYIAALIGKIQRWEHATHCFFLALFIAICFAVVAFKFKEDKEEYVKITCWISSSCLIAVIVTSFTLLTRPSYYHLADTWQHKWSVFSLQAAIIPLLLGIQVLHKLDLTKLHGDRMIIMVAVLDFADTWDLAQMMSKNKPPFIEEHSAFEILIQFVCSTSFVAFSFIMWKIVRYDVIDDAERENDKLVKVDDICSKFIFCSQLYKNLPFLMIRLAVLARRDFVDFEFFAKNVISLLLFFFDTSSQFLCSSESED